MPDNDDVKPDEENDEQDAPRLADLDVTDEAGQAVKGGIPKIVEGGANG